MRKTIMRRYALTKKVNNSNDPLATKLHKRKRSYVVNLNRKTTKDYFQKLTPHGSSSKNCWKCCKVFFINKTTSFSGKIILMEKKKLVAKLESLTLLISLKD